MMGGEPIKAICKHSKEIIFTESLAEEEVVAIAAYCKAKNIECLFTQSKRVLILYCDKLNQALDVLSEFGLIEYMGNLKEIIEWDLKEIEQTQEEEQLEIIFTPENEDKV